MCRVLVGRTAQDLVHEASSRVRKECAAGFLKSAIVQVRWTERRRRILCRQGGLKARDPRQAAQGAASLRVVACAAVVCTCSEGSGKRALGGEGRRVHPVDLPVRQDHGDDTERSAVALLEGRHDEQTTRMLSVAAMATVLENARRGRLTAAATTVSQVVADCHGRHCGGGGLREN